MLNANICIYRNPNELRQVKIKWPIYNKEKQQYLNILREMTPESVKSHLIPREDNFWRNIVPSLLQSLDKPPLPPDEKETGYCEKDGGCKP